MKQHSYLYSLRRIDNTDPNGPQGWWIENTPLWIMQCREDGVPYFFIAAASTNIMDDTAKVNTSAWFDWWDVHSELHSCHLSVVECYNVFSECVREDPVSAS